MRAFSTQKFRIGGFFSESSGSVAAITAIFLPCLLGAITFGLDHMRAGNQLAAMQSVADAAALASARQLAFVRVEANDDNAQRNATLTAIADGIVQSTLDDDFPETTTAAQVLQEGQVQVAVTARYGSLFGELGAFGENPFTVTSIAQSFGGQNICFIALGTDQESIGIEMEDSAQLKGGICEVYSNSKERDSLSLTGSAHLDASLICSAGGYQGSASNFSQPPTTDCEQVEDPLRDFPPPPMREDCDHDNLTLDGGVHTLNPGVYCGKTDLKNAADVWLNPGIYVFREGELHVHDTSRLSGKEVGLYFDDQKADFVFMDEGEVDLSAPVDGPMAGMLVAARPVCPGSNDDDDALLTVSIGAPSCVSGREFVITSSKVRSLLGTIHLPNDELIVDTTTAISEEAAFTIIVVGRMTLRDSPVLMLNTDYALTNVPIPGGFQGESGIPRLVQ